MKQNLCSASPADSARLNVRSPKWTFTPANQLPVTHLTYRSSRALPSELCSETGEHSARKRSFFRQHEVLAFPNRQLALGNCKCLQSTYFPRKKARFSASFREKEEEYFSGIAPTYQVPANSCSVVSVTSGASVSILARLRAIPPVYKFSAQKSPIFRFIPRKEEEYFSGIAPTYQVPANTGSVVSVTSGSSVPLPAQFRFNFAFCQIIVNFRPHMTVAFTKMNGAGNDFVLIDNRSQNVRLAPEDIVRICHRQRGVGADGILLLVPSRTGKADWAWDFYNSDGSTADMCGNGARCFARFIQKVAGTNGQTSFETGAGIIRATFEGDRVTVNLTDPKDLRLNESVTMASGACSIHSLNTGVPHAILFVPDADKAMVQNLGSEIRFHQHFAPKGTNANFVQLLGPNHIRVRTYERGVEGETLACGTGVTASAIIAAKLHGFSSPVKVQVQGGDTLEVSFREENGVLKDVHLTGPADFVFEGTITL